MTTQPSTQSQDHQPQLDEVAYDLFNALQKMLTTWEHGGVDPYPIAEARAAINKASGVLVAHHIKNIFK